MATSKIRNPQEVEDITNTVTFVNCDHTGGGIYRIGKMIIVQLRVLLTEAITGQSELVQNMPEPESIASGGSYQNVTAVAVNRPDLQLIVSLDTTSTYFRVFVPSIVTATIPSNTSIIFSTTYLSR